MSRLSISEIMNLRAVLNLHKELNYFIPYGGLVLYKSTYLPILGNQHIHQRSMLDYHALTRLILDIHLNSTCYGKLSSSRSVAPSSTPAIIVTVGPCRKGSRNFQIPSSFAVISFAQVSQDQKHLPTLSSVH